jgi:hypothetical protein
MLLVGLISIVVVISIIFPNPSIYYLQKRLQGKLGSAGSFFIGMIGSGLVRIIDFKTLGSRYWINIWLEV